MQKVDRNSSRFQKSSNWHVSQLLIRSKDVYKICDMLSIMGERNDDFKVLGCWQHKDASTCATLIDKWFLQVLNVEMVKLRKYLRKNRTRCVALMEARLGCIPPLRHPTQWSLASSPATPPHSHHRIAPLKNICISLNPPTPTPRPHNTIHTQTLWEAFQKIV